MPDYSSFIRSIRVRYVSGLLLIAVAAVATMLALNHITTFRRDVDTASINLVALTKDLRNATEFAETASGNWRAGTRGDLAAVARTYVKRIGGEIDALSAQIGAVYPRLSKDTRDLLSSAAINGDLFWSPKDMVRNLNRMAAATGPNTSAWSRSTARSAMASPPSASITARSVAIRPGSCPVPRGRSGLSAVEYAAVSPVASARSASNRDPA